MKAFKDIVGPVRDAIPALQFDADHRERTYLLVDAYCDDLQCKGQEALIYLLPDGKRAPGLDFHVDLSGVKVRWEKRPPKEARAVVLEFMNDRKMYWWLVRRRQVVRAWSLIENGKNLAYEPGQTYSFEFFSPKKGEPYTIPFELESEQWDVLDQYCVNPACDCEEAYLSFYHVHAERKVQDVEFGVQLDLKSGAATLAESDRPLSPDQSRMLSAFQEDLTDWRLELTRRRDILKKIAGKRLERKETSKMPTSALFPSPKVGRNDPCPCGSGKKFKKCCGSA